MINLYVNVLLKQMSRIFYNECMYECLCSYSVLVAIFELFLKDFTYFHFLLTSQAIFILFSPPLHPVEQVHSDRVTEP